ncbi:Hypothetical protein GSB_154470, partial [Giardia duodenalis]
VNDPLVGISVGIRPTEAVQVGEGAGDLGREGNDRLGGDRLLPPPVFHDESFKRCVMTVHYDVDEVPILVLNYLVVPEDARVGERGERRQLEPEGLQCALAQAVEPDLFHGEAWVALDGAHDAEGPSSQHAALTFTQLPEVENGHTEALQGRIECVGILVNHAFYTLVD